MANDNLRTFLDNFSVLERELRSRVSPPHPGETFPELLSRAAPRDAMLRRLEHVLREYANLRDAIEHKPVTDVAPQTVNSVRRLLADPPTVAKLLGRKVEYCLLDDPLSRATRIMYEGKFSQLPVYPLYHDWTFQDLLTTETITRWFDRCLVQGQPPRGDVSVQDVLPHAEDRHNNYDFLQHRATVFEALQLFDNFEREGKCLDAIILTADGRKDSAPTGILTPSDIPQLSQLAE
jgi:hypothetical protein